MGIAPYAKVYQTPAQCLAYFAAQGLGIPDQAQAERILAEIGQDRLRPYCLARRDFANPPDKPFLPNTSFDDVVQLYRFDEQLRSFVFSYCARVETIFKTSIAEVLSKDYDPHPYFLDAIYASQNHKIRALSYLTSMISKRLENDIVAKNYYAKHNDPPMPPIWTTKEFMTFGGANFFTGHLSNDVRNKIAGRMHLPEYLVLDSWIKNIVDVRNICAHHNRLFNRGLQKKPIEYRRARTPSRASGGLASVLECINYIINVFDNRFDLCADVRTMLQSYPAVRAAELGF